MSKTFSLSLFVLPFMGLLAFLPGAECQTYNSAVVNSSGKLTLTLSSGATLIPQKLPDQVSFSDIMLSNDRHMVGWLAGYADEESAQAANALPMSLVLYRSDRLVRTFGTNQIFWSWKFAKQDRDIAFCTGPTHGGAASCELRRIGSGKRIARWSPKAGRNPPAWTADLSY